MTAHGNGASHQDLLLSLLDTPHTAFDLIHLSSGRIPRNSIYTTLRRMEEKGLVASRQLREAGVGGHPKRIYHRTVAGALALPLHLDFSTRTPPRRTALAGAQTRSKKGTRHGR